MKKILLISLLLIALSLSAFKNWETFTNTTNLYDITEYEGKLYLATWGGIVQYENGELTDYKLTTVNGLSSNDVRALKVNEDKNNLMIATSSGGIDRISGEDFILPISETIGLPSSKINKVIYDNNKVFVATNLGLSIFEENSEFPMPILIGNYNNETGLSDNDITSIEITDNGYLFCGSSLGLDYISIDSLQVNDAWHNITEENSNFPSSNINSISANGNVLAVGTKAGLSVANLANFSWEHHIYSDSNEYFSSVYPVKVDTNNNIWFGLGFWSEADLMVKDSVDVAVCKLDSDGDFSSWNKDELSLYNTKINNIKQIGNKLYFLTWGEGFFTRDLEENLWSAKIETNCMSANFVTELQIDGNNRIWLCSGHKGSTLSDRESRGVSVFNGVNWENYTTDNSNIYTNNIFTIAIDENDRKWFGTWGFGINIFDEANNSWSRIVQTDYGEVFKSNTIPVVEKLFDNTMAIAAYAKNILIFDDTEIIHNFILHEFGGHPFDFSDFLILRQYEDLYIMGTRYNGIRIWEGTDYPQDGGDNWIVPPCAQMKASEIYDIQHRVDGYGNNEYWIASSEGLFCYKQKPDFYFSNSTYPAGNYWYRYGQDSKKKQIYLSGSWRDYETPEYWYVVGQPHLYGGAITYPTALFVDHSGLVWIGTAANGFTVYDIENDLFLNYNKDNSPLISNNITDFEYDPISGKLYIGTIDGLNSVEIGISADNNSETKLNDVVVYPNPFYPEQNNFVRIENKNSLTMPKGDATCKIFDISGELIITLDKDIYEQFSWNGENNAGKKCASGVYFYLIAAQNSQTAKGKIVLVR